VPIEDNGGSGSTGSHWERVTFGNEGMTASGENNKIYIIVILKKKNQVVQFLVSSRF
jgi:hypothetical protein